MDQSYSLQQLRKYYKEVELKFLGISERDFEKDLKSVTEKITDLSFDFDFKYSNGNIVLADKDLSQKVVLRKINDNIKKIYKDEQANRRIIISQIKALLEETSPCWILKTDIKNFYESIDNKRIISRLRDDAFLSFHTLNLLKKIFNHPLIIKGGLPRGVNISSTLSEYYMRKFDKWAKQFPGVFYYARFVDDIIIFANSSKVITQLEQEINSKLEIFSTGLKKNEDKTSIYEGLNLTKKKSLNYLGYKFYRNTTMVSSISSTHLTNQNKTIQNLSCEFVDGRAILENTQLSYLIYEVEESKEKNKQLRISISDNKVNKIKSRIVNSFIEHTKKPDKALLESRIKFLTGNYPIRVNVEKNILKAGIYYNYLHINDFEVLLDLDFFYRKLLFSKSGSLGIKISTSLTNADKMQLNKYSFQNGFNKKIYFKFNPSEMGEIVKCW